MFNDMEWIKKQFLKLILWLYGGKIIGIEYGVDHQKIEEWLIYCFKQKGYMNYYTLRKKTILEGLAAGKEGPEYWKEIGRLAELRALNANIKDAIERDKKLKQSNE
jgi:hypothetical protein